jgi:hypothetical protein
VLPEERWDPEHIERAMGLDDGCAEVLAHVAAGVAHMPDSARRVLLEKMRLWQAQALAASGARDR